MEFWVDIQKFHYTDNRWNKEGLTELGLRAVERLKEKYANNLW